MGTWTIAAAGKALAIICHRDSICNFVLVCGLQVFARIRFHL